MQAGGSYVREDKDARKIMEVAGIGRFLNKRCNFVLIFALCFFFVFCFLLLWRIDSP